jgi:quercetin dioxygenase-like cupin family protein
MPALILAPGAGERHPLGPSQLVVKAGAQETGGGLYLGELVLAAGAPGPPLHRHARMHDLFYVLEGTLTVRVDDAAHELPAGGFACIPPGVAHTVENRSGADVRLLNLSTPGGFEAYMRDLAEAASAGLTAEAVAAVAARHDVEVVPEPDPAARP